MSAVPASIHLKTNVDRIYLLLLKTVLSFPSLLSKTMSIFQDFFKTFLQFSQIQDYFQDLNEFINFKTFSSLEENVRTMFKVLAKQITPNKLNRLPEISVMKFICHETTGTG